ncbi:MFS transporter [Clostridium zeae]|uniref:MFS transporter n=1 Tax=Clostridium zeae TaxID=2759022 RepID=A0ABQ1EJ57_9CLOT|nr:MFS transporter [Clostridium zeae]GFZ34605.1 MFS transporter [Clostridium zeae]
MTKQEKSWILYDFANSAYSITITTAILPVFFKTVAAKGLDGPTSTAYWGYANSVSTLLVAIIAPLLGTMADYKFRKKRFFLVFTLVGIISTALLMFVGEGNWLTCLIIYTLTVIGFSGSCVFYDSFITDVTDNDNMDNVSSLGFAWGYIGGTIPFLACILLIMFAGRIGISTVLATELSFLITAIWWFIFTLPILKNVKQIYFIEPEPNYIKNSFKKLWNTFKKVKQNKEIFLFLLAFFFYIDGVHTIISMATAFGLDIGMSTNMMMIVLVVLQVVAFPCSMLYGKLAKKFSSGKMILFGIITYCIVSIYGVFIKSTLDFWILAILVGSAQGGIQALSRSYFGKLIPKENSAEYYGIYNIFGRISSVFGPLLMGIIGSATNNTRYGVLSLIVLFAIGAFIFIRLDSHIEKSKSTSNNKVIANPSE